MRKPENREVYNGGKFYGRLKDLRGKGGLLRLWHTRHAEPEPCCGCEFWPPAPRDMQQYLDTRQCVAYLLKRVRKQARRVIYLRYIKGMSFRSIAAKHNLSSTRIQQLEAQGMRSMRYWAVRDNIQLHEFFTND